MGLVRQTFFLELVPTIYLESSNFPIFTHQYSVTNHTEAIDIHKPLTQLPGNSEVKEGGGVKDDWWMKRGKGKGVKGEGWRGEWAKGRRVKGEGEKDKGVIGQTSRSEGESEQQLMTLGIFFSFDLSPMLISISKEEKSILHLLTRLCAVIGGTWVVFGLMFAATRRLRKEWNLTEASLFLPHATKLQSIHSSFAAPKYNHSLNPSRDLLK